MPVLGDMPLQRIACPVPLESGHAIATPEGALASDCSFEGSMVQARYEERYDPQRRAPGVKGFLFGAVTLLLIFIAGNCLIEWLGVSPRTVYFWETGVRSAD